MNRITAGDIYLAYVAIRQGQDENEELLDARSIAFSFEGVMDGVQFNMNNSRKYRNFVANKPIISIRKIEIKVME